MNSSASRALESVSASQVGAAVPVVPAKPGLSIRARLLLLILATLLPLLILNVIIAVQYASAERRVVEAQRADVVNNLTYLLHRDIAAIEGVLQTLAVSPALLDGRTEDFRRNALASAKVADISAIAFTTPFDPPVIVSSDASGAFFPQPQVPSVLNGAFEDRTTVSDVVAVGSERMPVFYVNHPVYRQDKMAGVLSAAVKLERFQSIFAEAGLKEDWVAAIVDRKGTIAARSRSPEKYVGGPARPAVAAVASGAATEGVFANVTLDGIDVLNIFRRSAVTGWTSVVAVPTAVFNAPLRQALMLVVAIGLALTALAVGLAVVLASRIARPLQHLGGAALAVVEGRTYPAMPNQIAELQEVQHAFDHAVRASAERKVAEGRQRASEAAFHGTFHNAAVGMAHIALDGTFTTVNDRLCDIVGHGREELLGKRADAITHPDDRETNRRQTALLLSGSIASFTCDTRFVRADGDIAWVGSTVSLQPGDASAPAYFIAVIRDIGPRKQAEGHQRFLMRELTHRTKNLLAVIQAIARQSARRADGIEDFTARFSKRIQGISASHDLLVNQDWRGAPLGELVKKQLAPFLDEGDARVKLGGPDVMLRAEDAQAIGLALHELATNAIKYGALSVPGGIVSISWSFEARHDGDTEVVLKWRESNGPPVKSPERKGFGHAVVQTMVASSVGGAVQIDYALDGLNWMLSFPAPKLARA